MNTATAGTQGRQATTQQQAPALAKAIDPNAALLDEIMERTVSNMDIAARRFEQEISDPNIGKLKRAVITGAAIQRLRQMMTPPVMQIVMSLMNSSVGFKTDRGPHIWKQENKTPYDVETVKDCAIVALLKGVLWSGNEFNIIAGQCYITREGYERKLKETPGLTDLVPSPGVPYVKDGKAYVRFGASWKFNGIPDRLADAEGKPGRTFEIIVNKGSGPDQMIGKAFRKGLKAVYDQIHGSAKSVPDDDPPELAEGEIATAPSLPSGGRHSLKQPTTNGHPEIPEGATPFMRQEEVDEEAPTEAKAEETPTASAETPAAPVTPPVEEPLASKEQMDAVRALFKARGYVSSEVTELLKAQGAQSMTKLTTRGAAAILESHAGNASARGGREQGDEDE